MKGPDGKEEDVLDREVVERRGELRGSLQGLWMIATAQAFEVLEASRKAIFIGVDNPETFRLGDVLDARVHDGDVGHAAAGRFEVIRKELAPRRGVALRLIFADPDNEARLAQLLGPLA